MNIRRILCPVDFSNYNHQANDYACLLAKSTGAEITYFHAYTPDAFETPPAHYNVDENQRQLMSQLEEFIRPNDAKIRGGYVVEAGLPIDRIVHYAEESDIDLIVMATHGRSGIARVFMGSVASAVIRKAKCPVMAVKVESDADDASQ